MSAPEAPPITPPLLEPVEPEDAPVAVAVPDASTEREELVVKGGNEVANAGVRNDMVALSSLKEESASAVSVA